MLIWIDIETEGLDPNKHQMLEIAMVITDDDLNEKARYTGLVSGIEQLENVEPYIIEMHKKSGLLEELSERDPNRLTVKETEQRLIGIIEAVGAKGSQLAGSTISFDRKFLTAYMPRLLEYIHYRNVDVTTLNELSRRWAVDVYDNSPPKGENHRALPDILESIEILRHYRRMLFLDVAETVELKNDQARKVD